MPGNARLSAALGGDSEGNGGAYSNQALAQESAQPIEDLIAKLEAATEGNRELDAAIERSRGYRVDEELEISRAGDHGGEWDLPLYTTSIDAALTLVPEGMVWTVLTDYGDLCRARVYNGKKIWEADGETPPLAACSAALKARVGCGP